MSVVVSVDLVVKASESSVNIIVGVFEWVRGLNASNLVLVALGILGDNVDGLSFNEAGGHQ